MRSTTRGLAALTAGALALVAACAAQTDETEQNAPSAQATEAAGVITLTVGVLPFAELAPLHLAQERGIFERHGLDVQIEQATGGGAVVASLISGDISIVYSNYVTLIEAWERGLPIRVFRENDRPGVQALYTMPDGGVESPDDLSGALVAINSLGNIMELTSRAVLDAEGVDSDTVEFVEISPADMEAMLVAGNVDAAWLVEPFVTLATEASGVRPVISAFQGPTEDLPVAGWATTEDYLTQQPDAVARFRDAIDEAMEAIAADPAAAASIIPTFTAMSEELAAQLTVGYAIESDLADVERVLDLMVEYGVASGDGDLEELLVDDSELGR